jgi:iron complex transport system ATP-binding protein
MNDPELLILDEPAASLDLTSREDLLAKLNGLISSGFSPSILMVTHHLEEIPTNFTHAMLLNSGSIFLTGRIDDVLTEDNLSEVFQNKITLIKTEGRRFGYQKN